MNLPTRLRIAGVVFTLLAPLSATATDDDATLLERLRAGGYSLYFRHAQTDWSQHDQVRDDDDIVNCDPSQMRQLSEQGRATARDIGAAIRALEIPISKVVASPYCRTQETAKLMDLGAVQTSTAVMNMRVADRFGGRQAVIATAQELLATPPPAGGNVVIVAHGNVARDATPVYPGEAEGVVFEADGRGGFSVVARIPPQRWHELASRH